MNNTNIVLLMLFVDLSSKTRQPNNNKIANIINTFVFMILILEHTFNYLDNSKIWLYS